MKNKNVKGKQGEGERKETETEHEWKWQYRKKSTRETRLMEKYKNREWDNDQAEKTYEQQE